MSTKMEMTFKIELNDIFIFTLCLFCLFTYHVIKHHDDHEFSFTQLHVKKPSTNKTILKKILRTPKKI